MWRNSIDSLCSVDQNSTFQSSEKLQSMAGATALDTLPHLHSRYGNYDISHHTRPSWVGGEPSVAFEADINRECQKNSCFSTSSARPQAYLEPPVRARLQMPPADNMNSTAYQPQQHRGYGGRQDVIYPSTASYPASTGQQLYPTNQSSRASSASAVLNLKMPAQSYPKAHSPHNTSTTIVLAPVEETARRKSSILPSLQIPASINNSGGSIGEFAAQVCVVHFV